MKKKFGMALRVALAALFAFALAACTDSYETTTLAEEKRAQLFADDAVGSWLISQQELNAWVNAGHVTPNGKKVVIVDVSQGMHTNFIPGAVHVNVNAGGTYNIGMVRNDGPRTRDNVVVDGPTMDGIIRYAGIDANTVVVITSQGWTAGAFPHFATRGWWTFYYWGFPKSNLKLLNGGNQGYAFHFPAEMVTAPTVPTPSTFSVRDLAGNRIDRARAPIGSLLEASKNGDFLAGRKFMINTQATADTNITGVFTSAVGTVFHGLIGVGGTGIANTSLAVFLDPAQTNYGLIRDDITAADFGLRNGAVLPANLNTVIWTHCGSGQSTTPYLFILIESLGYRNAGSYNGSTGEWGGLAGYRAASGTQANDTSYLHGSAPAENRKWLRWDNSANFFRIDGGDVADGALIVPRYNSANADEMKKMREFFEIWDTSKASNFVTFVRGSGVGATVTSVTCVDNADGTITHRAQAACNNGETQIASTSSAAATNAINSFPGVNFDYRGDGREVNKEDRAYQENPPTTGGGGGQFGDAPAGGC